MNENKFVMECDLEADGTFITPPSRAYVLFNGERRNFTPEEIKGIHLDIREGAPA